MNPPPDPPLFSQFSLDPRLLDVIERLGFSEPTPIQAQAIGPLLEGRDVIGRARTGSGKTAAFGLPMLQRLRDGGTTVRALVLAPTRELALQVTEALRSFAKALPVRVLTIYGGAPYGPQLRALKAGVPIVVGTPGRVLDHLDRGSLDLSQVEVLVLDEADEMLRMGFFDDVERVLEASPAEKQVVLFSATMPDPIRRIAERRMKTPLEVQVESSALSVHHIDQRWLRVPERFKADALVRLLAAEPGTSLVFARTRAGCADIADELARRGLSVDALHGDLNQGARERVLTRFRAGKLNVVVATDVAARGIDVEHISLVVNLDLPNDPEQYVHRIGRTARAGRPGHAVTFVTPREEARLGRLARILQVRIAPMDVPSDADIAQVHVDALQSDLSAVQSGAVGGLLERLGTHLSERQIAEAALTLLARDRGIDPTAVPDTLPPTWARPKPRPGHPVRDHRDEGYVALFLPVGTRSSIGPPDIVGAIANQLSIPGKQIGRITVLDGKTFVEVPREVAKTIVELHPTIELRGRSYPISLARPRTAPTRDTPKHPANHLRRPKRQARPRANEKRWNRKK